jgi:general secretion pathway protein D
MQPKALRHPAFVTPGLTRGPASFPRSKNSGTPGQARGDGRWALASLLALAACAPQRAPLPVERPVAPDIVQQVEGPEPQVRSTVVGGQAPVPVPPDAVTVEPKRGAITVNFPAADVRVVAKAVLGDLLRVPYSIGSGVEGNIAFVTPGPVARSSLLALFETALRGSNLALVKVGDGYEIQTAETAKGSGPIAPGAIGYGSEILQLQFIDAGRLKALLDSVLPGVASVSEGTNALTIVGTTGQRASARDLIRQFDVNWLRNMTFALFVPERTDSRLIAPELDKLINANDAPTKGLVRIIQMDRLNGILAISAQPQYIEDVRRWVEVLDREGQSAEPRLFVYKVQNARARDLANTINAAFGNPTTAATGQTGNTDPFAQNNGTEGTSGSTTTSALLTPPANANGSPAGTALANAAAPGVAPGQAGASGQPGGPNATGRITADEVNNAILVYGTPRQFAVIEDALRRLDVRPVQIMIEAAITEVTLTDELRYGVQWNWLTGNSNFTLTEGRTTTPTRNLPGFSYYLAGNDITLALNALEQRTNVKVISAPKVLVLNNQTAALQVGDQVPITTAAASNLNGGTAGSSIVNSIEYRDTGVILKVTPRVNASGLVLLDISQEVSDVANRSTGTNAEEQSPTISTRRVSTSIAAQDGQVLSLGGLFRNSQSFGKNGIPILSRIPVLGALFGDHGNTQNRTELIVLIKPHVIRSVEDGTAITEELRRKLRTLEPFKTEGRIP